MIAFWLWALIIASIPSLALHLIPLFLFLKMKVKRKKTCYSSVCFWYAYSLRNHWSFKDWLFGWLKRINCEYERKEGYWACAAKIWGSSGSVSWWNSLYHFEKQKKQVNQTPAFRAPHFRSDFLSIYLIVIWIYLVDMWFVFVFKDIMWL